VSSRMGILGVHPAVFVRVRNKGDKSRQRTSLEVRPQRRVSRSGVVRRTARRTSMDRSGRRMNRLNQEVITYFCNLSIVNYKCFRCCGIAGCLFDGRREMGNNVPPSQSKTANVGQPRREKPGPPATRTTGARGTRQGVLLVVPFSFRP